MLVNSSIFLCILIRVVVCVWLYIVLVEFEFWCCYVVFLSKMFNFLYKWGIEELSVEGNFMMDISILLYRREKGGGGRNIFFLY